MDATTGATQAAAQGVTVSTTVKNTINRWHSFGTGSDGKPIVVQTIKTGPDVDFDYGTITFQWDDPFDVVNNNVKGVTTDFDILVFSSSGTYSATRSGLDINIATSGTSTNEPIEIPATDLNPNTTYKICILETKRTNPSLPRAAGYLRYSIYSGDPITGDFITPANPDGYGHPSSALGNGIAAYNYDIAPSTEAGHVFKPGVETFSSNGPSLILFDSAGNRLAQPITRKQPVFSAVDNVNTSFFPPSAETTAGNNPNDYEGDKYPNFAGTSAATPHAAAIAALLLNAAAANGKTLTPKDVRSLMIASTQGKIDEDPGFSKAMAGPVLITATGEGASDPKFFKISFNGIAGQQLTQLVIDLTDTGLHFDPASGANEGYPFTAGTATGTTAPSFSGTPTVSGGPSGKAIATLKLNSFDPGDTLTFGVDRDVDGLNAYGNSADQLAGATITATVSGDANSPYAGTLGNTLSRSWNFKAGYGLLDAQTAVNLLLNTQ